MDELTTHAVADKTIFFTAPDLITIAAGFTWKRCRDACVREMGGCCFDVGGRNELCSINISIVR